MGGRPSLLRQREQLQQEAQPGPQEPRQGGHIHCPEAMASAMFSPWRLRRHDAQKEVGMRAPRAPAPQLGCVH